MLNIIFLKDVKYIQRYFLQKKPSLLHKRSKSPIFFFLKFRPPPQTYLFSDSSNMVTSKSLNQLFNNKLLLQPLNISKLDIFFLFPLEDDPILVTSPFDPTQ